MPRITDLPEDTVANSADLVPIFDSATGKTKKITIANLNATDGAQPLDADLTAIAALSPTDNDVIQRKAGAWTNRTPAQLKADLALSKSDVGLSNVPNTDATSRSNHTGTQLSSTISDLQEAVEDIVGAQIVAGSGVTASYNDTTGKVTVAATVGGGTGDVVGPSSATDNAAARFDTTTGKLIQSSAVAIDDSGNVTQGQLLKLNHATSNTEVDFQEAGTTRAKVFYDNANNRLTLQNVESSGDDAVYIPDSITTTGAVSTSQTTGFGTSTYKVDQDAGDLLIIQRTGDSTGDGNAWSLIDLISPTATSDTDDSESTLSLSTRGGTPTSKVRTLDLYNDEYSRDNGVGFRQLYANTTPNPLRFEHHDKTTNSGAWTMAGVSVTNGSPNGSYTSSSGATPSAEDWIWDNAGTYFPDDTKLVSIDTTAKTFVLNRNATATGSGVAARGKTIREIMRITPNRVLLVRKFIEDSTSNALEVGGAAVFDSTVKIKGGSPGSGKVLTSDASGGASWQTPSGGGGSGTVVGPVSSTDNAIVRWDATTGALVQDSVVTVDDNGNVTMGKLLKIDNGGAGNPEFDFTVSGVVKAKTYWDATNNRLTFQNVANNNADALYFVDPITTTGNIVVGAPGTGAGSAVTVDATQTLTNKTLTSPAINTPTGIVKGDVGLGNVDNTSDATKNSASATLTNKTLSSPTITGTVTGQITATKAITGGVVTLTDAATIATDASLGNHFEVTLGGNRTLGNPTNPTDGQKATWEVLQDATGSRTLSFGTAFAFGTDIPSITLTTTASKRDFIGAVYNAVAAKWYVIAFVKGY